MVVNVSDFTLSCESAERSSAGQFLAEILAAAIGSAPITTASPRPPDPVRVQRDGTRSACGRELSAELAYIIALSFASEESITQAGFRRVTVESASADVIVTICFTRVDMSFPIAFLPAIELDPAALWRPNGTALSIFCGGVNISAWRDFCCASQSIGTVICGEPAAAHIDRLAAKYEAARRDLGCAA